MRKIVAGIAKLPDLVRPST
jgi:hypothetical protein